MKERYKILLFFIITILAFVFASIFQTLYEKIFGPARGGWFWGPENVEGFITGYIFFISLAVGYFSKKRSQNLLILLISALILGLAFKSGNLIIITPIVVIVAWLLAQGILFIKKSIGNRD